MKRYGNLYASVISLDNLRLADAKARRGKQHTYGVRRFDRDREANLLRLHEQLLTRTYRTSPYDVFRVHEPKEREIYRLPYYPDRIVHHAIMNVLEPIWVRTFTHNTFSCIKGRGISGCARYVERIMRRYRGRPLYCLKIDIKKFYPSLRHSVLMRAVRRKIKDPDLLWLLDEIICSPGGGSNLPIGNYLSQYLANLALAYMMHDINERERVDCAEYADDIVFFADSKQRLRRLLLDRLRPCIEDGLSLQIKGNWQIFPLADSRNDRHGRALDYVGFKFYRHQRLLRKGIKQNLARRVARLNRRQPPLSVKDYKRQVAPWLGWAQHSNSKHLLRTLIPHTYESILQ